MKLTDIRKKIDHIDFHIMKLLSERMELAVRTARLKETITDGGREQEVLNNICRSSHRLLPADFSREIFTGIIAESKRLQEAGYRLFGFQGEHGAHSEMAAEAYDSQLVGIPCREFSDVVDGLEKGIFDLGILPVENTLGGPVTEVNHLLTHRGDNFRVVGEIRHQVCHCLLALKETGFGEIKTVYSHPQALAQCRGFISRGKLEARSYYDTAGAARMLSLRRPGAAAVIAGKLCAEMYNLEVLEQGIQDESSNITRFVVIE